MGKFNFKDASDFDKAKTMKVNLTKNQYETLMKLAYLGNWMANANRDGSSSDPHIDEYEKMEDYVFSFAKEFGLDEFVDHEEKDGDKYYPTRKFEEETDVYKLREEYDEETFWEELCTRLGERDFFNKYTKEEIEKMTREERFTKMMECQIAWEEEFEEYGIERLMVDKKVEG